MNKQYIDFLAKELIREKLIIFVGAGASIDSKLPSWNGLVRKFAQELGIDKEWFNVDETLVIPEIYYKRFGKVPYYEILEEIFSKKYEPNSIHKALEKLNVNYLITTNFDALIEETVNENYDYDIIKKDEDLAHSSKSKMIIKMHGDLDNKNIILRKSEFGEYEKRFPLISTFIKGLFTANTILFIGYSLNDPNVKNIMSWIKNILNEDFRKVYLVEYDNNNDGIKIECDEDQIINKIILPDLSKEEYSKKNKKELLENKGQLLKDFLEDIYFKAKEKKEEENNFIYSNLNYLTDINLKKLLKNFYITGYTIDEKGLVNDKSLANRLKNDNTLTINKYKDILTKSNIKKINDTLLDEMFKEDLQFQKLLKKQRVYDKLIDIVLQFNEIEFEKFLKTNSWIEAEYISISGYIFFEKYELAKEKAEVILKQYKKENNKEKIIWTYSILDKIENLQNNKKVTWSEKTIDLKKIYNKYFKRRTELYNEVIEWKTLEKSYEEMDNYLSEAKKSKNTSYGGFNPLERAQFLIRDIYKFHMLNGVSLNSYKLNSIIKKYIEILLIAYKNHIEGDLIEYGLVLKEFSYYDFYLMIQSPYKDLTNLFKEHNVEILKCAYETSELLIETLKNILNIFSKNDRKNNTSSIEIILLLFYKIELTKEQFETIIDSFINVNQLHLIYENCIFYQKIQDLFLGILYKNENYLNKENLEKIILNMITSEEATNDNVVGILTYYYCNHYPNKLNDTENLQLYFSRNSILVKIYFLRLLDKEIQNIEIQNILELLKNKFDLKIYTELLRLDYIGIVGELEEQIIQSLDEIFKEKYIYKFEYSDAFESIYFLLEKNKLSNKIINNLKIYKNENFIYYLEKNKLENQWNYFLDKNNFNYNYFTIGDLRNFNEFGIKNIIEKGVSSNKFIKILKEYLNLKSNDEILKGYLRFSFENIERGVLKKMVRKRRYKK